LRETASGESIERECARLLRVVCAIVMESLEHSICLFNSVAALPGMHDPYCGEAKAFR